MFYHQLNKLLLIGFSMISLSLGAQVTIHDYQRADSVKYFNNLVYHSILQSGWIDSTDVFWYKTKTTDGIEFFVLDAKKRKKNRLFDSEKFLVKLNGLTNKKYKVDNIPLTRLHISKNLSEATFELEGYQYSLNLKSYKIKCTGDVKDEKGPYWGNDFDELGNPPVYSPDSNFVAFVRDYNIQVKSLSDSSTVQLSHDGSAGEYYSSYIQWSPDSKKLITLKVRPNTKHYMYFVESSPSDQFFPKLHQREYLRPGDALPIRMPSLFDIEKKKQVQMDCRIYIDQFSIDNLTWAKNSSSFTFEYNQRGHQLYQVVRVNAQTGEKTEIINEKSDTFIDYSSKRYRHNLDNSQEIIWASERDGWNHLYLFDAVTGKLKNQITSGEWVVREVVHVDDKGKQVIFSASGMNPGEDPYFAHYYKIDLDGSHLVDLTPEKLNHHAVFSSDYKFFIDTYSAANVPPKSVLRETQVGKVLANIETADIKALLAKGYKLPEPFVAKARDGKTDIWGNIYRPTNFDSSKVYPIIEYIYAGPQSSFVQKTFRPYMYTFSGLSELGFIVVQIDGMGTSNRSKAFHDVCYKNLKDGGFQDRILWIKAAARKYPYMDTTRVGIFGGSAGGQNSTAGLLFHPQFYKVGVSSCGCHDNRMDKIWWNEQWMGFPIDDQYKACSNIENAGLLQGDLMLIVGEMDDNVDPASTYRLANALIEHNKEFELVVLPGSNHTLGGDYGEHKRRDFFVKNLLGQDPPPWKQNK
jgi:dienelactone hydrolase